MNTRFKVFASYNILLYLCDFIHDLIFVFVAKCRKSPKLSNIYSDDLFVIITTRYFMKTHIRYFAVCMKYIIFRMSLETCKFMRT
jgi:hypothetical protein